MFLSLPEQQGPGGRRGWGGRSPSCKGEGRSPLLRDRRGVMGERVLRRLAVFDTGLQDDSRLGAWIPPCSGE